MQYLQKIPPILTIMLAKYWKYSKIIILQLAKKLQLKLLITIIRFKKKSILWKMEIH